MEDILSPLSGHAILVLLLQLAGLLVLARVLAEGMRRVGQPAVIGELLAGVLLGPTILGHFAPELFALGFPQETAQFHLLEVISWLGMVLLLLLTGLETDIRALRNLGRAAFMASVFGMVVPFAGGLVLGWLLPDRFLVDPASRPIFAAFLATAMAISAMPVIAKILIDLKLIRRNVGMVILSAGVVDDTTGWLVLSVIAGIAAGGTFDPGALLWTLAGLALFLAAMRWVAYPAMSRAIRYINEEVDLAGADLTLIIAFTFAAAAVTEALGIHAVFGAFVAGLLVRQLPRVRGDTLHTIEVFVLSALSPIFFAFVGLRVDLWQLTGWELPLLVIGVAVAGKLVGCYVGGRLGRLSHWESLALGFGMNARGAMELIVALIGLSLGLLTQEMYSTIVMVAVVTSFMAPLLLRWALPRLPMGEDERQRLEDDARDLLLPTGPLRILVPTAGGSNAMEAMRMAAPLARHDHGQITALFVDTSASGNGKGKGKARADGDGLPDMHEEARGEQPGTSRRMKVGGREREAPTAGREEGRKAGGAPTNGRRKRWPFGRRRRGTDLAGTGLDQHLDRAARLVGGENGHFQGRRVRAGDVGDALLEEAQRDYDLLFLGAAPRSPLHDPLTRRMVESSPVGVVVVRQKDGGATDAPLRRILLPVDGSRFSRYAAELAFAYAGAAGASVTVLHVVDQRRLASGSIPVPDRREARAPDRERSHELERQMREELGPLATAHGATMTPRILVSGSPGETIIDESRSGHYDLLILGSENKMLGRPLFFGQGTADILERAGCTTAVVLRGAT